MKNIRNKEKTGEKKKPKAKKKKKENFTTSLKDLSFGKIER